jgi:hypothetical protein
MIAMNDGNRGGIDESVILLSSFMPITNNRDEEHVRGIDE